MEPTLGGVVLLLYQDLRLWMVVFAPAVNLLLRHAALHHLYTLADSD